MRRHIIPAVFLALLAGCATPAPLVKVVTKEVRVPVPTPCLNAADLPRAPVLQSDAALLALDDYGLVLELAAERAELRAYAEKVQPLLEVCE